MAVGARRYRRLHRLSAAPAPGTVLCRVEDLADLGTKGFSFWTGELMFRGFVVRHGERIIGWRDRCPHIGTPLSFGDDRYLTRDGAMILCSTHGAVFRIEDGLCLGGPCAGRALTPWPVEVRGDDVVVA